MKNMKFASMGKKMAHLVSRNILSTAAVIALMGAAAFAAAPAGGYLPGATLNPDCAPNDTDCIVQGGDMTNDTWTMSGANVVVESGNVGIGTDTPDFPLHIVNNYNESGVLTGLRLEGVSSDLSLHTDHSRLAFNTEYILGNGHTATNGGYGFELRQDGQNGKVYMGSFSNTGTGAIQTNTYNVTIDQSNGNVGIGTISPSRKLEVAGDIGLDKNAGSKLYFSGDKYLYEDQSNGEAVTLRLNSAQGQESFIIEDENGSPAVEFNIDGDGGDYSYIKNGNVGIGTTSPSERLEVVGNIKASGTVCDVNGCIGDSSGGGGKFVEGTNATFAVYTGGNVGIGTDTPDDTLEVNGSICHTDNYNGGTCLEDAFRDPLVFNSIPNQVSAASSASNGDSFAFEGKEYVAVQSPTTGKLWLDRNLGASRLCESIDDSLCFGDQYQWGRKADGHERAFVYTTQTKTLAQSLSNTNASFIIVSGSNKDWLMAGIDDDFSIRQQIMNETNGTGICPNGWRVPTKNEILAENSSDNLKVNMSGFMKIPRAGSRNRNSGNLGPGQHALLWSSTPNTYIRLDEAGQVSPPFFQQSDGYSIRCIKD